MDTIGLGLSAPKPPRVKSNKQKKSLIQCSQCAAKVQNLKKHMKKVHPREMSSTVESKESDSLDFTDSSFRFL